MADMNETRGFPLDDELPAPPPAKPADIEITPDYFRVSVDGIDVPACGIRIETVTITAEGGFANALGEFVKACFENAAAAAKAAA